MTERGQPAYVEPGTIAQMDNQVLTLGGPSFIWMSRDAFMPGDSSAAMRYVAQFAANLNNAGFVFDSTGIVHPVGPPPSGTPMSKPRLFGTGERLGVLWGQRRVVGKWGADRVWYATTNGKEWRDVLLLADSVDNWFQNGGVSGIVTKRPTYAVTREQQGTGSIISVGTLDESVWRKGTIAFAGSKRSVTAVPAVGGAVVLVVGFDFTKYGVKAIRLNRSGVADLKSAEVIHLDSASDLTSSEYLLVNLGRDSVIAIWESEKFEDQNEISILHSSVSADGGRTWKSLAPFDLKGVGTDLTAAPGNHGALHLLYASSSTKVVGGAGTLEYMVFRDGNWKSMGAVTDRPTHGSAIGFDHGRTIVTWSEYVEQEGLPVPAPRTYVAWSKTC